MKKKEDAEVKYFYFCNCRDCRTLFWVDNKENDPCYCPKCGSEKINVNDRELKSRVKGLPS